VALSPRGIGTELAAAAPLGAECWDVACTDREQASLPAGLAKLLHLHSKEVSFLIDL
jgi:hypothetical protein